MVAAQWLANLMGQTLNIEEKDVEPPTQLLDEVTFEGVAKYIRSDQCKKVIVMAGAGISTCTLVHSFLSSCAVHNIYNSVHENHGYYATFCRSL